MINTLEILEQLRAGKPIERIGDEITAVLNMANQQYQEEERAKKAEKEKHDSLVAICDTLVAWIKKYYPKAAVYASKDMSTIVDTFIETFDYLDSYSNSWLDIINLLDKQPKVEKVKGANTAVELDWEDLINKFINE